MTYVDERYYLLSQKTRRVNQLEQIYYPYPYMTHRGSCKAITSR